MAVDASSESLTSVIEVFSRVFDGGSKPMSLAAARYFAKVGFSTEDKARMTDLAVRHQCGGLSRVEISDLDNYSRAGVLLGILPSRARKSLKKASAKLAESTR